MNALRKCHWLVAIFVLMLAGCISPDNATVEGTGTPDVTGCSSIPGVADGADFEPQKAVVHGTDGRTYPDLFYIAWAQLDSRTDLRFPTGKNGTAYSDTGFEDKLLVSRLNADGTKYDSWQVWPPIGNDCKDTEKVRIHSFDVAPDGKSLFVSMSRQEADNPGHKLGIYRLDIASQTLTKISKDNNVDFINPAYIGNDPISDNEMLVVAKTVQKDEIPINYAAARSVLEDEYDRAPTPLIHTMNVQTGDTHRIGFNNSHQTEPTVIDGPSGGKLVIFNQWEHQDAVNRFSLWKMQIDGSDNFTYFGQESSTDNSDAKLYAPRVVRSGPYKGYVLMGQGARNSFTEEGHILMTKRENLDLRSNKVFLEKLSNNGVDQNISRSPEHYNDQSFAYAYRATVDDTYSIYVKDYPTNLSAPFDLSTPGTKIISNNDYHFVQPRSFYPPASKAVVPTEGDLNENRVSFTNKNLNNDAGFLVENITMSDNGAQHQVGNPDIGHVDANDLRLQFFIPSHHFEDSNAIGMKNSQEMIIPASNFIKPEDDGSLGVILKEGLYTWRLHKRFSNAGSDHSDIWVPIRAERQEVSFVKNRVNGCNQCHMERSEDRNNAYANKNASATRIMKGSLSELRGTDKDISKYDSSSKVPDFYKDIIPLLAKPGNNANNESCIDCHNAKDKLDLANTTGISNKNPTYRNLLLGAHNLSDNTGLVPFVNNSINPMGAENLYHAAPFLWSLLLNDDLTVQPDNKHPNASSRVLDRSSDYGAVYNATVEKDIAEINAKYDHSTHWSAADIQKFITYTTTQIPAGLSDRMTFQPNSISSTTPQAQKAYQAMVRQCFNCHTSNFAEKQGVGDEGYGLPLLKRFTDPDYLTDPSTRFVLRSHLANKSDRAYSPYTSISDLSISMKDTLASASQRIDFNNPDESELLVYARGGKNTDGSGQFHTNVSPIHPALDVTSPDYLAIKNWIKNTAGITNQPPSITSPAPNITLKEYDDPAFLRDPLNPTDDLLIRWSDPDGDPEGNPSASGDYSQAFINGSGTTEHSFNDTMLALEYQDFNSAKLKTYAILGDRGQQNFEFTVTDGLSSSNVQRVPVTVTSDYQVPLPSADLPAAYAFYTVRATGELRKLDTSSHDPDTSVGFIPNYKATWTTVYRRADKGWLYFLDQDDQRIHVVDEKTAQYLFSIKLDRIADPGSVQTVPLIWWRPAEDGKPGELQGLLKIKLSQYSDHNGVFYVGLGDGEPPPPSNPDKHVTPNVRPRLVDGANTIGVYVWRRATFMTKWNNNAADNGAIDRVNVLNLVTGKAKPLASYSFTEQTLDSITYPAKNYLNVRALVVADDGAFYGFNKDLNSNVEVFNFDPLRGIQKPVTNIPSWISDLINDKTGKYATPFVVIDKRPVTP